MWKKVGEQHRPVPQLSAAGRRDRRQGFHRRASVRRRSQELAVAIARGGFEYQGQKCSARKPRLRAGVALARRPRPGGRDDARHEDGRRRRTSGRSWARSSTGRRSRRSAATSKTRAQNATIVQGGGVPATRRAISSSRRWLRPRSPTTALMREEIFGPVVTAYVYPDAKWAETLDAGRRTSPYALTGAVFAQDRSGDAAGVQRAPQRGRQLLHQRQADRRRRRPAAVRRRAGVRDQRQGGIEAESDALGQRAHDQGNVPAAARLRIRICRTRRS